MKKVSLVVAASLTLFALILAPCALSKEDVKRHSVLDYFFLLPFVGNTSKAKNERQKLLDKSSTIVDVQRDFIQVDTDSFPPQQVAVYRYRDAELVAVSVPDSASDYNLFYLYRLRDGKLREVTEKELPLPARAPTVIFMSCRATARRFAFTSSIWTNKRASTRSI